MAENKKEQGKIGEQKSRENVEGENPGRMGGQQGMQKGGGSQGNLGGQGGMQQGRQGGMQGGQGGTREGGNVQGQGNQERGQNLQKGQIGQQGGQKKPSTEEEE